MDRLSDYLTTALLIVLTLCLMLVWADVQRHEEAIAALQQRLATQKEQPWTDFRQAPAMGLSDGGS